MTLTIYSVERVSPAAEPDRSRHRRSIPLTPEHMPDRAAGDSVRRRSVTLSRGQARSMARIARIARIAKHDATLLVAALEEWRDNVDREAE